MDSMLPTWLLPLWIIGTPVLLVVLDHLRIPKSRETYSDSSLPLRGAVHARAFR